MNSGKDHYKGQIETVLHYVNSMIVKNWTCEDTGAFNRMLSVSQLANLAGMSIRNFQLIFKAYTGETLRQYIIRLRLEYAQQLLKENRMTGTEISEYIGIANQSALNNMFQKKYNSTPQQKQVELLCCEHDYPLPVSPCHIVEMKLIPVLFFSYIGDYETCTSPAFEVDSWDMLFEYAKQNNILPDEEDYWGIAYDDTDITQVDKCRFYACVTIRRDADFIPSLTNPYKRMDLPGGVYAVYTHRGDYALLNAFYDAIFKQLPQHYHLGETPFLEHYLNSPVDTAVEDLLTEIWLPIVC